MFARTSSGIANSPKFFGCDLLIYIEGRESIDSDIHYDESFYKAVGGKINSSKIIKIKSIGNRSSVISMHEKTPPSANNIIFFVDKDYSDILFTDVIRKNLYTTRGYSWENDFWTEALCRKVVEVLTVSNTFAIRDFGDCFLLNVSRLVKISRLDILGQFTGNPIMRKNYASCGVDMNGPHPHYISREELKRHYSNANAKIQRSRELKDILKKREK